MTLSPLDAIIIRELKAITGLSFYQLSSAIEATCDSFYMSKAKNRPDWIRFGQQFANSVRGIENRGRKQQPFLPWTVNQVTDRNHIPLIKLTDEKLTKNSRVIPPIPEVLPKPSRRPYAKISLRFLPMFYFFAEGESKRMRLALLAFIYERTTHDLWVESELYDFDELGSPLSVIDSPVLWAKKYDAKPLVKKIVASIRELDLPVESICLPNTYGIEQFSRLAFPSRFDMKQIENDKKAQSRDKKEYQSLITSLRQLTPNIKSNFCPMLFNSHLVFTKKITENTIEAGLQSFITRYNEHTIVKYHETPEERLMRARSYWPERAK